MKIEKTNLKKKVNDRKIVLLAITGTLTALEAGKISVNEAECFLFSPFMAEVLKSCNCSRDIVEIIEEIIEEGCELEDIESLIPESLPEVIKNLRKKRWIFWEKRRERQRIPGFRLWWTEKAEENTRMQTGRRH